MLKQKLGFFQQRSLHEMIMDFDERTIETALKNGTDCNILEYVTILHAVEGVCEEKKIFVAPLHLAVLNNQHEVVDMLLKHGANFNAFSGDQRKPIEYFDPELLNRVDLKESAIKVLDTLFNHGDSEEDFIDYFGNDIFNQYKTLSLALRQAPAMNRLQG